MGAGKLAQGGSPSRQGIPLPDRNYVDMHNKSPSCIEEQHAMPKGKHSSQHNSVFHAALPVPLHWAS